MRKYFTLGTAALAASVMAVFSGAAVAGKPGGSSTATALKVNALDTFYDGQDTNAFNGQSSLPMSDPNYMCSPLKDGFGIETARVRGDAYVIRDETATTWTPLFTGAGSKSNPSSIYEDGRDAGTAAMRAQFISSNRVLSIDTTTTDLEGTATLEPRKFTLDFATSFNPSTYEAYPTVNYPFGTQAIEASGLFEVLGMQSSLLDMKTCTTPACLEGTQVPYARYWFTHPNGSGTQYRLDWNFTRVLRIDLTTWYFIGGDCDGSQTAGLSVLEGTRTKPRMVNMGWFEMPFFFKVTLK